MRTAFLIDGFNFYHSLKETTYRDKRTGATRTQKLPRNLMWFNYKAFCQLFLNADDKLQDIYYFTALSTHKPDSLKRHRIYLNVLEDIGIKIVLGRFKNKKREFYQCKNKWNHPEEKETDVKIALEAYALAHSKSVEKILLVSGDTDFLPVLQRLKQDFPAVATEIVFPFNRHSQEFLDEGFKRHKTSLQNLQASLFPRKMTLSDGSIIERPKEWM